MTAEPPTILVVDDQPENIAVLAGILQPRYRVRAARSGEQALHVATTPPTPDLALLDVMMPEMDGFTLLARLRELPGVADLPVMFLTALGDEENEQHGLALGAVDYLAKPVKPAIVLARVRTQIELAQARRHLREQNLRLEDEVARRTQALDQALQDVEAAHARLKKTYFVTLAAISDIAGLRAGAISEHARRVATLSRQVVFAMGMGRAEAQDVFIAALLHDIGKVGFPDRLLAKPVAALTRDELDVYRAHATAGAALIGKIEALTDIAALVRSHHELYNGTGFPDQLSGLGIPLGARIICAASDYEDLKAGMMGRHPLSAKRSGQYLVECAGSRYDPQVIAALEPIIAGEGKYEIDELRINVKYLQEGMVLTRDVVDSGGFVLLARGNALTRHLIDQLAAVARHARRSMVAHVERRSVPKAEVTSPEEIPVEPDTG